MDRYKAELFLSGLEGARGDDEDALLISRRGQLDEYQSRWLRLEFASINDIPFNSADSYDIVGGVFAWRARKEASTVRFFQLGSTTRGVPRSEWKVKCEEVFLGFKIDPASNVFVTLTPVNK